MRIGRPTPAVSLTVEERETLEQWARRPKTAQALAQRARIVLACATEQTNGEIAETTGVTRQTVGRWRTRFAQRRMQGLLDERKSSRLPVWWMTGQAGHRCASTRRCNDGECRSSRSRAGSPARQGKI